MSNATTTRRITRAAKYVKAKTLPAKWSLLSKARRRYASHLVRDYGCPVRLAIQQAYIFGYCEWQKDYRTGMSVRETRSASSFGL